jgi:hypothetical protein
LLYAIIVCGCTAGDTFSALGVFVPIGTCVVSWPLLGVAVDECERSGAIEGLDSALGVFVPTGACVVSSPLSGVAFSGYERSGAIEAPCCSFWGEVSF